MKEYVNPGSGSVSWRICATVPKGRQLSIPFCFDYDSAGVHHLESNSPGNLAWNSNTSYLAQGGWSYSLPQLSEVTRQDVNGSYQCDFATDYLFQTATGERHPMYLSVVAPAPGAPSSSCSNTSPSRTAVTTAGEGPILASTTAPSGSFAVTATTITDADGTRYIFHQPNKEATANGFAAELPDLIEDRNGNQITVTDSGAGKISLADTVGRTLLATSGFGATGNTVQISGQSAPYTIGWGTASTNFTVAATVESGSCTVPLTVAGSQSVITSITLPDNRQFQFQYDSTYGLLEKIIFPTGGYIRYAWGLGSQAEEGTFDASSGTCSVRYDQPVLTDRYVSLDGTTEILHQSRAYTTTWGTGSSWSSKQTTVTNYDLLRGTNFQTAYTYAGYGVPLQPNDDTASTLQIPLEQTIVHKDWNGATLRTLAETWNNPRELASQQITENDNEVSKQTYAYDQNEQQTEKDEYGYGSSSPGSLTRITVHAYGCNPAAHIVDRPTTVEIEDVNHNRVAETDYAYDQSPLQLSGAVDGRDPAYASTGSITARCNVTTLTKYNYTGNISEAFTYDDAGNPLTHTDGNGNTTSYAYGSALEAAYVTQTTLPSTSTGGKSIQHSVQMGYDLASGLMTSRTDVQNGITINYSFGDPLDRPTEIDFPDGGKTTYAYASSSVETKRLRTGSTWTDHFDHWDGLGNSDRSLTYNGTNWDTVDTAFDGEQLPLYVSYPYFSSGTASSKATTNSAEPGDTSAFDGLGRATQVTRSDGAVVATSYSGPNLTITDEAGRQRQQMYDALGRLIEVKEYTDSLGDHYSTYYGYGLLDDLKSVTQGTESRTFDYDNLNRLVDATNPESGTVSYTYDNNGNLIKKQDANGTIINYTYDALNRLRTRSHTVASPTASTPSVQIDYDIDSTGASTYDAYGHMTRVIAGSTSIGMDQYDAMGRLETYDTAISGANYHTSLRFDYIGDPVWESYPDGRTVNFSTDQEGRPYWAGDGTTNYAFSSYRDYNPAGALAGEGFGNGLVEFVAYNNRLQPTQITVKNPNDATNNTWRMNLSIGYTQSGVQTADNGNVVRLVDNLGNASQAYTLHSDNLNRLSQWTSDAGTNCQFAIDAFGNLNLSSGSGCGMIGGLSFNGHNQIVGYTYDPSGNLLSDTSGSSYTWDANNQLVSFAAPGASGSYVYDGLLRRDQKVVGTTTTTYVHDALGNIVAELTGGTWTDYIFANRAETADMARDIGTGADRIAEVVGTGVSTVHFFHKDQVGTTRAITDQNAANLVSCSQNTMYPNGSFLTYSPLGTPLDCTQSISDYQFVAHEQDPESLLGQFRYRKYSSLEARWVSADPAGINGTTPPSPERFGLSVAPDRISANCCGAIPPIELAAAPAPGFGLPRGAINPSNPQSWNSYNYALNKPALLVDPNGTFILPWRDYSCFATESQWAGGLFVAGVIMSWSPVGIAYMWLAGMMDLYHGLFCPE